MREKAERFVVYLTARVGTGEIDRFVVASFDNYPTDDQLENVWNEKALVYNIMYHLSIEKQIRFN